MGGRGGGFPPREVCFKTDGLRSAACAVRGGPARRRCPRRCAAVVRRPDGCKRNRPLQAVSRRGSRSPTSSTPAAELLSVVVRSWAAKHTPPPPAPEGAEWARAQTMAQRGRIVGTKNAKMVGRNTEMLPRALRMASDALEGMNEQEGSALPFFAERGPPPAEGSNRKVLQRKSPFF